MNKRYYIITETLAAVGRAIYKSKLRAKTLTLSFIAALGCNASFAAAEIPLLKLFEVKGLYEQLNERDAGAHSRMMCFGFTCRFNVYISKDDFASDKPYNTYQLQDYAPLTDNWPVKVLNEMRSKEKYLDGQEKSWKQILEMNPTISSCASATMKSGGPERDVFCMLQFNGGESGAIMRITTFSSSGTVVNLFLLK